MARFDRLEDWLNWQEKFHPRSIDLGLERAFNVFKLLNPEGVKPITIVVAGTNGKGSSIAFLEAIYKAQGYRVGSYTSPHIIEYNERIRINGLPVSDELICQAFERIDTARDEVSLSYFEFGTLAALDIFWRSDLDIQLLEVGLGGRLDAVNIIDSNLCLITSISIDHVDWLGETRKAIAYEKAGVFRKDTPAVIGDIDPPDSLLEAATHMKTPLFRVNKEFGFTKHDNTWDWFCLDHNVESYLSLPVPQLKGEHQYQNAATVLMAISKMNTVLPVSEQAIHTGLKTVQLKGRFQLIEGDVRVLLDVAHNPQAVKALLAYLQANFANKKIKAVFAMMKDKDINAVIDLISPVIDHWIISPLDNPRAASIVYLADCFKQCGVHNVSSGHSNFLEAYEYAKKMTESGDLILIFGSFFLVSEYLAQIEGA